MPFLISLSFAGGFAACWFGKDKIKLWVNGVETEVRALEDKIKALRAKV